MMIEIVFFMWIFTFCVVDSFEKSELSKYTHKELTSMAQAPSIPPELQKIHSNLTNIAMSHGTIEGHSANFNAQIAAYYKISRANNANVICEIGFNAGHGASSFLFGSPRATYIGFDLGSNESPNMKATIFHGKHGYTNDCLRHIRKEFPSAENVEVIIGDSTQEVPKYTQTHPNTRCDLIHVDGGHFLEIPLIDLKNMAALSKEDGSTVVIVDDAVCAVRNPSAGCHAPERAWEKMIQLNLIKKESCVALYRTRGFCVGNYTANARKYLLGTG